MNNHLTKCTTDEAPYPLTHYRGEQPHAPRWLQDALTKPPKQNFINSKNTDIELLTWGEPTNPGLLLLHGNAAHAHWWSHIAPFFAEDWYCAALSFSGMGKSARRDEGYTTAHLAQEALDAIAATGMDQHHQKPIAIGHSLGGMVAMAAASQDSSALGGVVVIDTPIAIDPEDMKAIRARAPKARDQHLTFASFDEGLARFRLSPPQKCANDAIVDYIARHSLREVDDGWQWHFDPRKVSVTPGQTDALVDTVNCPIAYLYGEQSALVSPNTRAASIHRLPAGSPVIGIPDAQHHIMIDQPIALVSALRALLTRWPTPS